MEPSTPPRVQSSREVPATPATPRFGTFEDLPDAERKHARTTRTPHRRKRSAAELATPRQTPHKRKQLATPKQQVLFRSEPELRLVQEDDAEYEEAETEAESDGLGLELSDEYDNESSEDESSAARPTIAAAASKGTPRDPIQDVHPSPQVSDGHKEASRLDAHRSSESIADWGHPHQDKPPPNVPGMWYVFRGKKVFRPLPAGAKPVEPVTLFKKEIAERQRVNESEEDTDVEHAW